MQKLMSISRTSSFEMAHRLSKAVTTECNTTIHGHSYRWTLTLTGEVSNKTGMILDYSVVKRLMQEIDSILDHSCCLMNVHMASLSLCAIKSVVGSKIVLFGDKEPTAEVLALCMANTIATELLVNLSYKDLPLYEVGVQLKETENSSCEIDTTLIGQSGPQYPRFSFDKTSGLTYIITSKEEETK